MNPSLTLGIDMKTLVAFICILMTAPSACATSMLEDTCVEATLTMSSGNQITMRSDGDHLLSFSLRFGGVVQNIDVSFAEEVSGVKINEAKLFLDGATEAVPLLRHVQVPFDRWRGKTLNEPSLVLTFEQDGFIRAVVIANDDFDKPLHVFESASKQTDAAVGSP